MSERPKKGDKRGLTKREREILRLIEDGKSMKEIAWELGVSYKTVDTHRSHILNKVRLQKSVQAARAGPPIEPEKQ